MAMLKESLERLNQRIKAIYEPFKAEAMCSHHSDETHRGHRVAEKRSPVKVLIKLQKRRLPIPPGDRNAAFSTLQKIYSIYKEKHLHFAL